MYGLFTNVVVKRRLAAVQKIMGESQTTVVIHSLTKNTLEGYPLIEWDKNSVLETCKRLLLNATANH